MGVPSPFLGGAHLGQSGVDFVFVPPSASLLYLLLKGRYRWVNMAEYKSLPKAPMSPPAIFIPIDRAQITTLVRCGTTAGVPHIGGRAAGR